MCQWGYPHWWKNGYDYDGRRIKKAKSEILSLLKEKGPMKSREIWENLNDFTNHRIRDVIALLHDDGEIEMDKDRKLYIPFE